MANSLWLKASWWITHSSKHNTLSQFEATPCHSFYWDASSTFPLTNRNWAKWEGNQPKKSTFILLLFNLSKYNFLCFPKHPMWLLLAKRCTWGKKRGGGGGAREMGFPPWWLTPCAVWVLILCSAHIPRIQRNFKSGSVQWIYIYAKCLLNTSLQGDNPYTRSLLQYCNVFKLATLYTLILLREMSYLFCKMNLSYSSEEKRRRTVK